MSKFLAGIAALTLIGAASLPLQASAGEQNHGGATVTQSNAVQSDEMSSQRRYYRRNYGYRYGPRRYYAPRYGYGGPGYGYYGGYPYGYARPGIGVGIGPFGFRAF